MRKFTLSALVCLVALFSGCGGDGGGGDEIQSVKISFTSAGVFQNTAKKYEILIKAPSNTSWTISSSETWAKLDPTSGTGEATCMMNLSENPGNDRTATLTLTSKNGKSEDTYTFTQSGPFTLTVTPNDIDFSTVSDPVDVVISTKNPWEITNVGDATWVTFSKTSGTSGETIRVTPLPNPKGASRAPLNVKIQSGTTTKLLNLYYGHYDNMVYVYQENKVAGCNPVNILFIGDGYIKSDYDHNGDFGKHLETTIEGIFSLEPYKTYRDYFKVWVAVAYSKDQGVTVLQDFYNGTAKKQTKDTRFKTVCAGGSSTNISIPDDINGGTNTDPFRKYIYEDLKIADKADIENWTVLLCVNVNARAGTCTFSATGFSVARSSVDNNLGRRMAHEGGGHGFAKLSDEYYSIDATLTQSAITTLNTGRSVAGGVWAWRANTDITGSRDEVHWKHYFELDDYKDIVGLYEGCYEFNFGAWRPEQSSIMRGGDPGTGGFNAPSREAIVRRIMKLAGKTFDFDDFLSKDKADIGVRSAGYFDPTIRDTPPEEEKLSVFR